MNRYAIVLAAGKGTRMKTAKEGMPKVAFPLLGRPMIGLFISSSVRPSAYRRLLLGARSTPILIWSEFIFNYPFTDKTTCRKCILLSLQQQGAAAVYR